MAESVLRNEIGRPAAASGESFLLHQFRVFYSEVIRLKRLVRFGARMSPTALAVAPEVERPPADNAVWQSLLSLLERQALDAGQSGGEYGTVLSREVQYIMAVLADETFVHLDWDGKETWKSNLLESRLFQSHAAGDLFFDQLERLLQRRDPMHADIAAVYLMALALGFRGKYWGTDDRGQLDDYRQQLFGFIYRRHPELLSDTKRLFSEASAHTLTGGSAAILPVPWKWMVALVAVVVALSGISYGVWSYVSADVFTVAQDIVHFEVNR